MAALSVIVAESTLAQINSCGCPSLFKSARKTWVMRGVWVFKPCFFKYFTTASTASGSSDATGSAWRAVSGQVPDKAKAMLVELRSQTVTSGVQDQGFSSPEALFTSA